MANEEQYYNPIIQAMVASAQNQRAQEKLKQDQDLAKQHIASQKIQDTHRERQLDLEAQKLNFEKEHGLGMLEAHRKMTEAQIEALHLGNLLTKQKASLSGIDIGAALGAGQAQGIPNSQDALQNEVNRLRQTSQAQSEGTHEGAAPYLAAQSAQSHQQSLERDLSNHAQKMLEIEKQGGNAQELAKIHGGYQQSIAHINGANHIRGIALMHQLGLDSGDGSGASQARDLLDGIYNGTTDYKGLTQDQKRAVNSYASANGEEKGLPTDTKAYAKKLEAISGLQTIVDQYRNLANNFSRDSPGAFGKGNLNKDYPIIGTHGLPLLGGVKSGSDLDSSLNSMKASGGQLATYFDQQNRKSDAEILRQVTGAFDPKATKEQNLDKLDKHISQLQQAVKTTFTGMTPDRVNKILGDRSITDFGAFKATTLTNPKTGHKIETHDNGKTFIDSLTKQPVEVTQ